MKSNKFRILALALIAVLSQGTCTYAASSSKDDYTKEELSNLEPGWSTTDTSKSNYKVNSYINTFSSTQIADKKEEEAKKDSATSATAPTIESNVGNVPVSTIPSTGNKGDFWGKTSAGKWMLFEQGVPVSGWKAVKGKWYYMDPDGVMQTGWINDGETWYYLNSGGDMAYNTYVNGYYLDWSGAMQ